MSTISVQDLQRDLLAFLQRVAAGESFLIVSGTHPLAEVRPAHAPATQPRPFGLCAGRFTMPPDFDRPLPDDILKEFEGAARFGVEVLTPGEALRRVGGAS